MEGQPESDRRHLLDQSSPGSVPGGSLKMNEKNHPSCKPVAIRLAGR
jgi:hypothetical protein